MFVDCHLTCDLSKKFSLSFSPPHSSLPTCHIPACQKHCLPLSFLSLSVPVFPCPDKSLPLQSLLVTCECPSCHSFQFFLESIYVCTFFPCRGVSLPLQSPGGEPLTMLHSFCVLPYPSAASSGWAPSTPPLLFYSWHVLPSMAPRGWVPLTPPLSFCLLTCHSPCGPWLVSLAWWLSFCALTSPSLPSPQRVSALCAVPFFLCLDKSLPL